MQARDETTPLRAPRPRVPPVPCATCGRPVDPLRAPHVVADDEGLRYACSDTCREKVPARARPEALPAPVRAPISVAKQVREATLGRIVRRNQDEAGDEISPEAHLLQLAVTGMIAAALAFFFGLAARVWVFGTLSAVATWVAAGVAGLQLLGSEGRGREVTIFLAGPVGAALAGVAALLAHLDSPAPGALVGAAVAAGAVVFRGFLDANTREPLDAIGARLRATLPEQARVPVEHVEAGEAGERQYRLVPSQDIRTGEEVLVVEGESLPVDGTVVGGEGLVRLFPGTLGAEPRRPGDPVIAGGLVASGALRVRATRVGDDRALLRLGRVDAHRGAHAARLRVLVERGLVWGGAAMLGVALVGMILASGAGLAPSLAAAAAALLAAPLLAARRASEAPLVAAAHAAAERGIVYADARSLEDAGRVASLATGTVSIVTVGQPEVVEVHIQGDDPNIPALALAAALQEGTGDHPVAEAIRRRALEQEVSPVAVRRIQQIPGRGVRALTAAGEEIVLGNRQLLLEAGISVAVAEADATRAESRGLTVLFLGVASRVRAVLALRDSVRSGARPAVQRLFDLSIEVVLMSGDHRATVEALAKPLDVTHIKSNLTPAERATEVERLRDSGGVVAAVGRGGVDDAFLAAAQVPVVLGSVGVPGGERGVGLASDDIRDAAAAMWIARAARREMLRGTLLAFGAGSLVAFGAALGWVPPAVAALVALGVDLFALPAGARLLRRIDLRVPLR